MNFILSLFRPRTATSILSSVSRSIAQLDALAERKAHEADRLDVQAEELYAKARDADAESAHAERVAGKLAQLVA